MKTVAIWAAGIVAGMLAGTGLAAAIGPGHQVPDVIGGLVVCGLVVGLAEMGLNVRNARHPGG